MNDTGAPNIEQTNLIVGRKCKNVMLNGLHDRGCRNYHINIVNLGSGRTRLHRG